jgi:hypothetical protein
LTLSNLDTSILDIQAGSPTSTGFGGADDDSTLTGYSDNSNGGTSGGAGGVSGGNGDISGGGGDGSGGGIGGGSGNGSGSGGGGGVGGGGGTGMPDAIERGVEDARRAAAGM